jgi:hypothetical protein
MAPAAPPARDRDAERLPIAELARRLGRAPASIKAYLYDPTGDKARVAKARYRGFCRTCGADTISRNGKRDACRYCRRCRPGRGHAEVDARARTQSDAPLGGAVRERAVVV